MRHQQLHVRGSGSTSNNFDKFASNDGLSGAVVENLVLANHLIGVLGGILRRNCVSSESIISGYTLVCKTYVHGVATSRLLAGVAFSEGPVEGVGQAVLAEVAQKLLVNLERRDVGCRKLVHEHTTCIKLAQVTYGTG